MARASLPSSSAFDWGMLSLYSRVITDHHSSKDNLMFFNYQHFWGQWAYPKATAIIRTRFLKMPRRLTIMRAAEPSMLLFPTFQFILHHIEEVTSNRHNDDDGDLRQIGWLPNERLERDLVVLPNRAQKTNDIGL